LAFFFLDLCVSGFVSKFFQCAYPS